VARDAYGDVLTRTGRKWAADLAATEALRAERIKARGPLPMFDRGPYFAELKKQGAVSRPDGWEDPDAGWLAVEG
jgi:hypothetical protein